MRPKRLDTNNLVETRLVSCATQHPTIMIDNKSIPIRFRYVIQDKQKILIKKSEWQFCNEMPPAGIERNRSLSCRELLLKMGRGSDAQGGDRKFSMNLSQITLL